MRLAALKTRHRVDPFDLDRVPYFTWRLESNEPDVFQHSYRIVVTDEQEICWDSGVVQSRQQSFVEYRGEPLRSRARYTWTVTVRDDEGREATASAHFGTAFLERSDWQARWVESTIDRPEQPEWHHGTQPPAVRFERDFALSGEVRSARLYATAHGVYQLRINGVRPDDREFAPEHTVYRSVLYYQTYDIAHLLTAGANQLTLYVGDGWYLCPQTRPLGDDYRAVPAVLFQLEVEYTDGRRETIASDGSEHCATGPVRYSDLFWGEKYDATVPFGDASPVRVVPRGYDNLRAQPMPPVRPVRLQHAADVYTSPAGDTIVDFGQILTGRARVHVDAPRGAEITFEYFEVPDARGEYFNSMIAAQKDVYVSDGRPRAYEALFTFHGFRYVRVTGLDEVRPEDFTAVLLTSEKDDRGSFACSDDRLNRLYENVRWSQANNTLSIPTDCPTREKGGFTGDLQLYAPTALINEDLNTFLDSWLTNLAADQLDDGVVPMTVPFTAPYERLALQKAAEHGVSRPTGIAGWSDAVVLVPYAIHRATGNTLVLRELYEPMKRWCDYVITTARDHRGAPELPEEVDHYLWNTGFHFGEWLIPSQKEPAGDFGETTKESAAYVAPFFGAHSVRTFAEVARVLGAEEDAAHYAAVAERMTTAIHDGLMTGGRLRSDLMGGYVLAIALDLVPDRYADTFARKLVSLLEANGGLLDTGFLATPHLLDALVKIGRRDLALGLLWERRAPSWLYQIDHGATTIWESWHALADDGTPMIMSYDHYAFGCVDDWIFREVAGIELDGSQPGFQHVRIAPVPDERLDWCRRAHHSDYGELTVAWTHDRLEVTIPCNTTATVVWAGRSREVGSGFHVFSASAG